MLVNVVVAMSKLRSELFRCTFSESTSVVRQQANPSRNEHANTFHSTSVLIQDLLPPTSNYSLSKWQIWRGQLSCGLLSHITACIDTLFALLPPLLEPSKIRRRLSLGVCPNALLLSPPTLAKIVAAMMDILRRESKTSRKPLPAQRRSPQARTDQPSRGSGSAHDSAMGLARQTQAATRRQETEANVQRTQDRQDLERQMTRRWKVGDVYAPHDLSGVEMSKWKQVQQKGRPKKDVFDMLRINPLAHYKVWLVLWLSRCMKANEGAEFRHDVRVHDRDGTDQECWRHWASSGQPEEDCQSCTESYRSRTHAECTQASGNAQIGDGCPAEDMKLTVVRVPLMVLVQATEY